MPYDALYRVDLRRMCRSRFRGQFVLNRIESRACRGRRLRVWLLTALLVSLTGCHGNIGAPNPGQAARPDNRLPIDAFKGQDATWEGPELALYFSAASQDGTLKIDGRVEPRGPVRKYSFVDDAKVTLHFLDASGTILESKLLWASLGFTDVKMVRWTFQRAWPLPAGASAIGFSYRGTFAETGSDIGGDGWEVWRRP
jgi:hypothetical protein